MCYQLNSIAAHLNINSDPFLLLYSSEDCRSYKAGMSQLAAEIIYTYCNKVDRAAGDPHPSLQRLLLGIHALE